MGTIADAGLLKIETIVLGRDRRERRTVNAAVIQVNLKTLGGLRCVPRPPADLGAVGNVEPAILPWQCS